MTMAYQYFPYAFTIPFVPPITKDSNLMMASELQCELDLVKYKLEASQTARPASDTFLLALYILGTFGAFGLTLLGTALIPVFTQMGRESISWAMSFLVAVFSLTH